MTTSVSDHLGLIFWVVQLYFLYFSRECVAKIASLVYERENCVAGVVVFVVRTLQRAIQFTVLRLTAILASEAPLSIVIDFPSAVDSRRLLSAID